MHNFGGCAFGNKSCNASQAFSTDSVYNLANGVTIVLAATKSETATTDASASSILREVVKYVTPASPINF